MESIFNKYLDVQIETQDDLQGASCTVDGVFCGRAVGNVFNVGDAKDISADDKRSLMGKVKVFRSGEDPSASKPHMTYRTKIGGNLNPILNELARHFSPAKSELFDLSINNIYIF